MKSLIYIKCNVVARRKNKYNDATKDKTNSYDSIKQNVTHEVTVNNYRK
jgi:hypothetical protein